jgi:ferredoxin
MSLTVRIVETGSVFDATEGEDLLEVLQRNGFPIATSCGGVASCGLCRVTIVSGKEHLSLIRAEEISHLGNVAKMIGARLACQSKMIGMGEVVVSVPTVQDVEERKRRKSLKLRAGRTHLRGEPLPEPQLSLVEESPSEAVSPTIREKIEWRPRLTIPKREG